MQKKGPSDIQVRTEQRQQAELIKLQGIESQKRNAAGRRTRGRASLISGSERGIGGDKDFLAKNAVTREKLGVKATEDARASSLAASEQHESMLDAQRAKKAKQGLLDVVGGGSARYGLDTIKGWWSK